MTCGLLYLLQVGKFLYFLMEDNLEIQFTKKDGYVVNSVKDINLKL